MAMKMKRTLWLLALSLSGIIMYAQVKPSNANLTHFWDFEKSAPFDLVGDADGELSELATISNGVLDLTDTTSPGGFLSLPGNIIALNTYSQVTIETWATPSTTANDGKALMLWSFGVHGNPGKKYFFFTPARWGTQTACKISVGDDSPWANEDGFATGASIGDSVLHHYVITIDTSNIMILYVDGSELLRDTLAATHKLSNIANDTAFIGKSVYSPDPTWKGTVDLFAIWNKALSADEVLWLFQAGSKRKPETSNKINNLSLSGYPAIYAYKNRLFIKNLPQSNTPAKINIYNIMGSLVFQTNNFVDGCYLNLKAGVYMVRVNINNQMFTQKIVLE